jgi:Na+-driven multidrug efflux pump
MLNIFVALSNALAPFVGQNWGSRQFGRAKDGVTVALVATLVIGGSAYAALVLLSGPIATAFTRDPAVSELIRTGLSIYPGYITLSAVILIATAAFNATANAKFATRFVSAGQLLVLPACTYIGLIMDGYVGALGGMVIGQLAITVLCVVFLYRGVLRSAERNRGGHDEASPAIAS